jgi:hypothetical protein
MLHMYSSPMLAYIYKQLILLNIIVTDDLVTYHAVRNLFYFHFLFMSKNVIV